MNIFVSILKNRIELAFILGASLGCPFDRCFFALLSFSQLEQKRVHEAIQDLLLQERFRIVLPWQNGEYSAFLDVYPKELELSNHPRCPNLS